MTHLAIGLVVIWVGGLLVFAGRFLNFTRLLYNNLNPTEDFSRTGIFLNRGFIHPMGAQAIDPANLTELGKQYQRHAIRDERLALAWGIGGFALLTSLLAGSDGAFAIAILVTLLVGFYFWSYRIRLGRATRVEAILARGLDALMFLLRMK